jgi:hypothetical protein
VDLAGQGPIMSIALARQYPILSEALAGKGLIPSKAPDMKGPILSKALAGQGPIPSEALFSTIFQICIHQY